SFLWTDYLSQSSAAWRSEVGTALLPKWPTGVGGTGNEGVASYVQRTRFAIGYVEFYYARRHRLSDASLRNHDRQFVQAGRDSFQAAADSADWSSLAEFAQLPTDLPGRGSWPVTGASFILIDTSPATARNTHRVLEFFNWALHQGEPLARQLDYVPIPKAAV